MKQVILPNNKNLVPATQCIDAKFYGVLFSRCAGVIRRREYGSAAGYSVYILEDITTANRWDSYDGENIPDIANRLLRVGAEIFEFDTAKEMLLWATERM